MARVLVIGPGDMGTRIARGLAADGIVRELVLAGLPERAGDEAIGLIGSTTDVAARFEAVDCTSEAAVEDLIGRARPDLIVQCASLLSPWALVDRTDPTARAFARAGLGIALPMQLPVLLATMRAVRATGFQGPVANLSFPDVTNALLARLGLAPTLGLGNVTMQLLRVRGALRSTLGPDAELPLVRVLGHHNPVYAVMRAELPADDEGERVRVFLGEEGTRADELAYVGHAFAPGIVYNRVTATACLDTLRGLLAGPERTRISVPGPLGLPGGYPVAIENGRVELDLPPGQPLDEAIEWMERIGRRDGVQRIADDGTVTFSESAKLAVAEIAPWLTEPLHPDEAGERAARIRRLLADSA